MRDSHYYTDYTYLAWLAYRADNVLGCPYCEGCRPRTPEHVITGEFDVTRYKHVMEYHQAEYLEFLLVLAMDKHDVGKNINDYILRHFKQERKRPPFSYETKS